MFHFFLFFLYYELVGFTDAYTLYGVEGLFGSYIILF